MSISINIDWAFIAGIVGMLLTLLAYFLLQAQKLHGNGLVFQLMNAFGSLGVLLSLTFGNNNVSAFMMEAAWLAISIYGIVRARRHRHDLGTP